MAWMEDPYTHAVAARCVRMTTNRNHPLNRNCQLSASLLGSAPDYFVVTHETKEVVMPFDMEIWQAWVVLGIILFIVEIFVPAFLMGSLGIGAWAGAIAAGFGASFAGQVAAFTVTMVVVFFLLRPFFNKTLSRFDNPTKTGVQALIGRDALVIEPIDNVTNQGRVKIAGESWKAQSVSGKPVANGVVTVVQRIEGVTAFVGTKE